MAKILELLDEKGNVVLRRRIVGCRKSHDNFLDEEIYVCHTFPDPASEVPFMLPVEDKGKTYRIVDERD